MDTKNKNNKIANIRQHTQHRILQIFLLVKLKNNNYTLNANNNTYLKFDINNFRNNMSLSDNQLTLTLNDINNSLNNNNNKNTTNWGDISNKITNQLAKIYPKTKNNNKSKQDPGITLNTSKQTDINYNIFNQIKNANAEINNSLLESAFKNWSYLKNNLHTNLHKHKYISPKLKNIYNYIKTLKNNIKIIKSNTKNIRIFP